ncbi:hypothetical protein G7K_3738-t1 [Saitoella complicata NRRL Y-17804]|uniref:Uncharacterized protein n=1 Tax=Saitoella complicata (strain BCRC 22490 / CBS 7301 / JCM 7358 / NBRC 10748 / NRRL Y-17804) TaxID=698492 RepID=A0A0E9NIB5_SAICN|nr:hypothetical protein G7K_3738-t1 [Saitoella complicata NRRL Y-17804]
MGLHALFLTFLLLFMGVGFFIRLTSTNWDKGHGVQRFDNFFLINKSAVPRNLICPQLDRLIPQLGHSHIPDEQLEAAKSAAGRFWTARKFEEGSGRLQSTLEASLRTAEEKAILSI